MLSWVESWCFADVVAAHADGGDALAGGAEIAVDHAGGFGALVWVGGGVGGGLGDAGGGDCGDAGGGGGLEEVSAFHGGWLLEFWGEFELTLFERSSCRRGWGHPGWRGRGSLGCRVFGCADQPWWVARAIRVAV